MNTPTPTPRTDAAWSATFDGQQMSAGKTARALREHSQQLEIELAALRAERDQLRGAIALGQKNCDDAYDDLRDERDQFRAEVERLNAIGSWSHTCIHHTDEERKAWAACPCCLAADRARLDWLESPAGMHWQWQAGITRATIDAKMKEGAK